MQATCRLRSLFKTLISSYSSHLQILRPLSSSAVAARRHWSSDADDNDDCNESAVYKHVLKLHRPSTIPSAETGDFSSSGVASCRDRGFYADGSDDCSESAVYKHVLKFQRPSTITIGWWETESLNTARFIGTVEYPPKRMKSREGGFGVHTILKVDCSRESSRCFRIGLCMWNEIAEVSIKYLKPNDYIYVSGRLDCYQIEDENGKLRTKYNVLVNDINYVAQHGKASNCLNDEQFEPKDPKESSLEKRRNRLHLWHVFFANPFEWWDNRKCKHNPRSPDFKQKSTGEALWIDNYNDPPWIRKQLQLHDSRMAQNGSAGSGNKASNVSALVYDDL